MYVCSKSYLFTSSVHAGCGYNDSMSCPERCGFITAQDSGTNVCGSRVGIMLGAYDSTAKTYPRRMPITGPWWSIDMDSRLGGFTSISDTALINWKPVDDCNCVNTAISDNPSASDISPTGFVSTIVKENVAVNAEVNFHEPDVGLVNPNDCVEFVCTGLNNNVIVDVDGSLLDQGASTSIVASNTPVMEAEKRATLSTARNVYIVPGSMYRCA